jgi:DNA mismatch repair protein MLH1
LFYNVPARLSALRSSSEEYARILDVVTKYAVHNAGVSFLCKKVLILSCKVPDIADILNKAGTSAPDISTPSSTTKQAIRLLYGQAVAKDLLSTDVSAPRKGKRKRDADDGGPGGSKFDDDGNWMAQAHFTNANYHSKKFVLLLFINSENLLDHQHLWRPNALCRSPCGVLADQESAGGLLHRRSSERAITIHLPQVISLSLLSDSKSTRFHSIQLDPTTVDVNVHPTKREVHFLEEEAITECIADAIQTTLAQSGERTFEYQVGVAHILVPSTNQPTSSLRHYLRGASPPRTQVNRSEGRRRPVKTAQVAILHLLLRSPVPLLQRRFCRNTRCEHLVRTERSIQCSFPLRPNPERATMRVLVTAQIP